MGGMQRRRDVAFCFILVLFWFLVKRQSGLVPVALAPQAYDCNM
jgi:hypothetical protein